MHVVRKDNGTSHLVTLNSSTAFLPRHPPFLSNVCLNLHSADEVITY